VTSGGTTRKQKFRPVLAGKRKASGAAREVGRLYGIPISRSHPCDEMSCRAARSWLHSRRQRRKRHTTRLRLTLRPRSCCRTSAIKSGAECQPFGFLTPSVFG
jgi:hypothetical protein